MFKVIFLSIFITVFIYALPLISTNDSIDIENLINISAMSMSDFSISQIKDIASETSIENKVESEVICAYLGGEIQEIELEEYLIGVVAAEMPALFEEEALKAQAVAARTYVYYNQMLIDQGKCDHVHDGAVVCDDYSHCKAYIDLSTQNPWGEDYDVYFEKISNAVYDTAGQYIVFDGEPIAAVFHSTSSEQTESALDVWGTDIDYLQSVESFGYLDSPKFSDEVFVSFDTFNMYFPNFTGNLSEPISNITRSDTGGIINAYVGDILLSGQNLRDMFSLNSTNFTYETTDDGIIFSTKGYGHGVGLSQYGANSMAKDGKTYEQILMWYYTGVDIKKDN